MRGDGKANKGEGEGTETKYGGRHKTKGGEGDIRKKGGMHTGLGGIS